MDALDDGHNYVVDDRPRPDHPIVFRMTDDDVQELKMILEMDRLGLNP